MSDSKQNLVDSQQFFSDKRLKRKMNIQEYYLSLQQNFESQISSVISENPDYIQIKQNRLQSACKDSLKIIDSLYRKLESFKNTLIVISQSQKRSKNIKYRYLKNQQEVLIAKWLVEIGLIETSDGFTLQELIKEAKYNYLQNKIYWPQTQFIHNIEEFRLQSQLQNIQSQDCNISHKNSNCTLKQTKNPNSPINLPKSEKKKHNTCQKQQITHNRIIKVDKCSLNILMKQPNKKYRKKQIQYSEIKFISYQKQNKIVTLTLLNDTKMDISVQSFVAKQLQIKLEAYKKLNDN